MIGIRGKTDKLWRVAVQYYNVMLGHLKNWLTGIVGLWN